MPAKTRPLQTIADETTKKRVLAIAKVKGVSVSELTRTYIEKGLVVDLPLMSEPQAGGWPSLAELGDEAGVVSYVALRFGLEEDEAEKLHEFYMHLAEQGAAKSRAGGTTGDADAGGFSDPFPSGAASVPSVRLGMVESPAEGAE